GSVMSHVGVGHQEVVAPDADDQSPALRLAVDGDEFADPVAVANAGLGALAFVLEVLRGDSGGGIGEENVILANPRGPFHVVVRHQAGAGADMHFGAQDAVRADIGRGIYFRSGVDEGGGVDRHRSGGSYGCRLRRGGWDGRLLFL